MLPNEICQSRTSSAGGVARKSRIRVLTIISSARGFVPDINGPTCRYWRNPRTDTRPSSVFGDPSRQMDLTRLVTETLRRDDEFVLYRRAPSYRPGSPSVRLLAPASMQPALGSIRKIE